MPATPPTVVDTGRRLRDRSITVSALIEESLRRAHATQETIGAFITICDESARVAAREADLAFANGIDRGPLQGIPFAIKDIIATQDAPTTANSRALDPAWGRRPDATVVRKLRAAGAILIGKLGCHEFGSGAPDPATGFRIVKNPWDLQRTPGGSSTGSGASVAGGLVLASLGTDTGGSVRDPASYCGISGIAPTYGRVSREGCIPLGASLDVIGPLARTAFDCALMLQAMAGYDAADPTSAAAAVPTMTEKCDGSLRNVRIGVPDDFFFSAGNPDPEVIQSVRRAIEEMGSAGARVVDVHLPLAAEASAATIVIFRSEGFAYHEGSLRDHGDQYGKYIRRSLQLGAFFSASDYVHAQRLRRLVKARWEEVMRSVDVLVTPTIGGTAPTYESRDPDGLVASPEFTGAFNLVGFPAMSIPCGFSSNGLPIGMQIIGKPFDEPTMFKVADAYQRISDVHMRIPPAFNWPAEAES